MTETNSSQPTLLVGPPGSGKTRYCLERVASALQSHPLDRVWLVVRDSLHAAASRRQLARMGIFLGVEVGTFSDLYREILALSEGGLPVADDAALIALLREILEDMYRRGALTHFAVVRGSPGFVSALRERIAELKNTLVLPARLAQTAERQGDPALREIAMLYGEYQHRMQALGWADAEGLGWLGIEALRGSADLLRGWRLVVVDGFDQFSPAQSAALQMLALRVDSLLVTLPGDPEIAQQQGSGFTCRTAHRRFQRSLRQLNGNAEIFAVRGLPRRADLPVEISALERRLFEAPGERQPALGQVTLLEARSPDDEAREALRWIKARIVRDGFAPDACALIVPDFAAYRPAILAAAAEFGLPLRITRGSRLMDTPPVAALLDLLALPLRGFPSRLLLDTLRSPFFDLTAFGLRREDARALELISRKSQIVEGLEAWEEVLTLLAAAAQPPQDPAAGDAVEAAETAEDESLAPPALPRGAAAAALWQALRGFAARIQPPPEELIKGSAGGMQAWAGWLRRLLEDLRMRECCQQGAEPAWLAAFDRRLLQLAESEHLSGASTSAYAVFTASLQGQLTANVADDDLPEGEGAVLALSAFEARGLRFDAAALVGLAEGEFPEVERADPFLREDVRAELGIDSRLGREQAGIFYQLIARADRKLLLTRPYLSPDGETWEASPFWNAVREILDAPVQRVRPEDHRPLADAASPEELLFWAARRAPVTGQGMEEPSAAQWQPRFASAQAGSAVLASRLGAVGQSAAHNGMLESMRAQLLERYGAEAVWSASRLESYATCPFFFFGGAALGLEMSRPPKTGLESVQLGGILHEVLEQVFRESPRPEDVDAVLERLPEVAARVFASAPGKYAFRPTLLWEMQKVELLETLRAAVTGLAEITPDAGWQPVGFECRFGLDDLPPLTLYVDGQPVRLRGVIDRIDRDREGNLRVIDYKSGSSHLDAKDLNEGRRLQLPLYALAAQDALRMGRVTEGLYWKLFAAGAGGLKLSSYQSEAGQGPQGAFAAAQEHVARLVGAVREGDFRPSPPQGGCPSYCQVASWCWAYQPGPVY